MTPGRPRLPVKRHWGLLMLTHCFAALQVPPWTVAFFVLTLLAIAVLPLAAGHFWHRNRNKALVVLLLAIPVAVLLLSIDEKARVEHYPFGIDRVVDRLPAAVQEMVRRQGAYALLHSLEEFFSFIVLLGSLYTVSGGVALRGDLRATPLTNGIFLASGAVLANLVGTTGASMLLIRSFLQTNQERENTRHLPVFFIFLVSNVGGLLTPLGDPPLFLGFLRGIPFEWTLGLWPQWLVVNSLVLAIFLAWDTVAWWRESPEARRRDVEAVEPLRVKGLVNVLFLAGIVACVLLKSPRVSGALFGVAEVGLWAELGMIAMGVLSLLCTPRGVRQANASEWGPIVEVAVLFAGIFVTMVPALELLRAHGPGLGLTQAWQFFWLAGVLSSFLDNAPTYLVFATLAAGSPDELGALATRSPLLLQAVSCGAVFMGANTYIGNGPNFMVKAIADAAGFRTPSFFGYMLYSALVLLPVFALVTWIFFRP